MNILQLVPRLGVGGVEKSTVEVARHLALNGHKAVVVSAGGAFVKNLTAAGVRHYVLPVGQKNPVTMLYCFFRLASIIKKENIDIVHARSRIPALTGYFAARSTGRIFMTTAHGQYKRHLISRVMGWGKKVIVANETMMRYMRDNFNVPFQRMTVIPRGVDLEKFSFVLPAERAGGVFRVGMVCRFTPLKGHLDFLQAMSYVARKKQNIEVVLMGDISSANETYMKKIELAIRRLTLGDIVKFIDSDESVLKVMKTLDVLVSANREQEAFGRSVIEAQASGVPVVATKVGGVAENVIGGVTGLLCEGAAPAEMADEILRYAEDPSLMEKVAVAARKHVEENYSLEKAMKMTIRAYEDVLSRKNILIFKISSLGDIILVSPSIRAIRKRFPSACIKILVDVRFREVLDNCPYVDEVLTCDFENRDSGTGFLRLAGRLRREVFDMSVDFQNNRKSHLLAFLGAIPKRYGFNNGKLSFLLNRKAVLPAADKGPVEHQGYVLSLMGITEPDKKLEVWPAADGRSWAEEFLKNSWLKEQQELIAVSLSASKRWKTKNWPLSSMIKLTEMLALSRGARVVLLGTEEEHALAAEFVKKTKAKPINAVGKTNVSRFTGLIERCDALVTGDSAPMHVAAAVGTPFVALFGPTNPLRHLGPAKNRKVIHKQLKCAPCYKPSCFRGVWCMRSITPEEVFDAVVEVLRGA